MADGWTLNGNTLVWQGSGPAPFIPADQQNQLRSDVRSGGGFYAQPGAVPGASLGGDFGSTAMSGGSGTPDYSNLVQGPVGPQQQALNDFFTNALGGTGTNPIATNLNSLAQGQVPAATAGDIMSQIQESFRGARYGTDYAQAAGRGMALASEQEQLAALNELLGLGKTTAGMEFGGTQNALDRALQEFLGTQNPLLSILPLLLSASTGG